MGVSWHPNSCHPSLQYVPCSWYKNTCLTIPALERLHLLKKDASQIGMNARKAVKFLDRITSGKDGLELDPVVVQGPEEQYSTWAEVEAHFSDDLFAGNPTQDIAKAKRLSQNVISNDSSNSDIKAAESAGGALSQMLLNKLNFAKEPAGFRQILRPRVPLSPLDLKVPRPVLRPSRPKLPIKKQVQPHQL